MILEAISHMVDTVEDGNESALKVYANLKSIKEEIEAAMKQIFESVMTEAETYPEKTFSAYGFEFTKKAGSGRYSYTDSPEWNEMNQKIKDYQEQMQLSYKALQKGGALMVDGETGEEIPAANYTTNKDTISIKKMEV